VIKFYFFLTIILFSTSILLFAVKPPEGEGWNYYEKEKVVISGSSLTLLPNFMNRNEVLESVVNNNPNECLEMLYTMPLPEEDENLYLFLFNKLTNFHLMEGVNYFSSSKGGMIRYLEKSFIVSKKGSKKPIEDTIYNSLPTDTSFFIYQKDSTFGSNWYKVTINVYEDAIWLSMTNINRMWYYVLPLIPSGGLKIDMIIVPKKDKLYYYTLSQLPKYKQRVIFGMGINLAGAFDHRVSALQGWFARQIYTDLVPGQIVSN